MGPAGGEEDGLGAANRTGTKPLPPACPSARSSSSTSSPSSAGARLRAPRIPGALPTLALLVLSAAYVAACVLVYRGGLTRLPGAVTA